MDVHNKNEILKQRISKLHIDFILIDHGLCPDWSREPHRRRRDCIYLILDGKGEITVNGETIHPKKNCMVLLPRDSLVSLYSENETCYNKYWCDFTARIDGKSLFDIIDFPYMVELTDISRAAELFDKIDALHLKTDAASALMIQSALLELLGLFLENDTRDAVRNTEEDPFAKEIASFIEENLSKKLSVGILAKKMGFNEKYFISLFRKHFRTTPAQYIKPAALKQQNTIFYIRIKK